MIIGRNRGKHFTDAGSLPNGFKVRYYEPSFLQYFQWGQSTQQFEIQWRCAAMSPNIYDTDFFLSFSWLRANFMCLQLHYRALCLSPGNHPCTCSILMLLWNEQLITPIYLKDLQKHSHKIIAPWYEYYMKWNAEGKLWLWNVLWRASLQALDYAVLYSMNPHLLMTQS